METKDFIFFSILAFCQIIYYAGLWKIFEKAGEKGWKAIIPFYNDVTILKIIGKQWYYVFILFLPGINIIYFFFEMLFNLYRSFGKEKLADHLLGIFFYFGYIAYLGFSKEVKYIGPGSLMEKRKKTQGREWADSILFAVVAATVLRWMLFEPYKIPTPSMERSLLMGDFLFVSKFHYGVRTPMTPLQLPLTHQTLPGSEKIKSYLDWIKLPQYRLPALTSVKNNDVVVFNWPADSLHKPADLKTHYVKRCLAIAGDTFEIRDKKVYINGKYVPNYPEVQYMYKVYTTEQYSPKLFYKYDIPNYRLSQEYDYRKMYQGFGDENKNGYVMDLTPGTAAQMVADGVADSVKVLTTSDGFSPQMLFPFSRYTSKYTIDDYGPLWIPQKGATISMNEKNTEIYAKTIKDYEDLKDVKTVNGQLIIGGKAVKEYTFRKNYYFMIGDNRHSSYDSRYWGFVPDNFIVGKPLFIAFSMDQDPKRKLLESIRWKRVFKGIE